MAPVTGKWKLTPKWRATIVFILIFSFVTYSYTKISHPSDPQAPYQPSHITSSPSNIKIRPNLDDGKFHWANVPQDYPVRSMKSMPPSKPNSIPKIQHDFKPESNEERIVRLERLELVKGNFTHAWKGYKDHAWLRDEVAPISGEAHDHFGGWAATLVDSLGKETLTIFEFVSKFWIGLIDSICRYIVDYGSPR